MWCVNGYRKGVATTILSGLTQEDAVEFYNYYNGVYVDDWGQEWELSIEVQPEVCICELENVPI